MIRYLKRSQLLRYVTDTWTSTAMQPVIIGRLLNGTVLRYNPVPASKSFIRKYYLCNDVWHLLVFACSSLTPLGVAQFCQVLQHKLLRCCM